MRRAGGAAVVGAFVVALGNAQARADPPGMVSPAPPEPDGAPPPRRSPAIALGLSAGITGLGFAAVVSDPNGGLAGLGVLTMYIGPSIGRWYGGGSAAVGLLARTAGGALMVAAIAEDMNHPIDDCVPDPEFGETCEGEDAAKSAHERRVERLLYSGAAIWIAATVYDFVRAPLDARDFNREHAVKVAPTAMAAGNGALVPALVLSGRF